MTSQCSADSADSPSPPRCASGIGLTRDMTAGMNACTVKNVTNTVLIALSALQDMEACMDHEYAMVRQAQTGKMGHLCCLVILGFQDDVQQGGQHEVGLFLRVAPLVHNAGPEGRRATQFDCMMRTVSSTHESSS